MVDPLQDSSMKLGFDQIEKSIKKPKLIFKLKPKTLNDFIIEQQQQQNQETHLQIQREDQNLVEFKGLTQNPFQESSNGSGMKILSEKTICRVCGKCFPSLKSLSGHMRIHPERSWRGTKPPSSMGSSMIDHQIQNSSPSSEKSNSSGLLHSLRSWGSTDKRRRPKLTDNEKTAIDALLMLENLVVFHSSKEDREKTSKKRRRNIISRPSTTEFQYYKKPKICKENGISSSLFNQETIKMESKLEILKKFDELEHMYSWWKSPKISEGFNFNSQITSVHKNSKKGIGDSNFRGFSLINAVKELTQVNDQLNELKNNVGRHELKICNSMISTVEVLGGHQWKHDTNTMRAPIDSVVLIEETLISANTKNMGFDLNELPSSP